MSHASNILEDIIDTSFEGKKINLAKAAELAPRVITKLTQGQTFTPAVLTAICHSLIPEDARRLCEAVCRDILPYEFRNDIHISNDELNESESVYNPPIPLDNNSEAIFKRLRELCATEPETRAWLHRIGGWILAEQEANNIYHYDEMEKLNENSSDGEGDTAAS